MKYKLIFFLFTVFAGAVGLTAKAQPTDSLTFNTIDGDSINLNQFAGKKVMLILLPIDTLEADSLFLVHIDSVARVYADSIEFIGVPSYEEGYQDSLLASIKTWYRDRMQLSFKITTGTYTYNSSGALQHPLFRWITDEEQNGHLEADIDSYGQKFLLNNNGGLMAVLSKNTMLKAKLMTALINQAY
jgi:glutathione peroxidase-family protein